MPVLPEAFPEQRLQRLATSRRGLAVECLLLAGVVFAFGPLAEALELHARGWLIAAPLLGLAWAAALRTGRHWAELAAAHCPRCGHAFFRRGWGGVTGWLLLRSACAHCGTPLVGRGAARA